MQSGINNALRRTVLVFFALLPVAAFVGDENKCAESMECLKVIGVRPKCADGAICSGEPPNSDSVGCYRQLVEYDNVAVSSPFGEERKKGIHRGIDLRVPSGTPVKTPRVRCSL